MTALLKTEGWFTPEEYLAAERSSETKNDYLNGYLVGMAGAKYAHNIISRNLTALLFNKLADTCVNFPADMKIRIEAANCFRYPDISAVCGPVDFYDEITDTYCNPNLIAEILSDSTEKVDRNEKFAEYRLIGSFSEYLLVSSKKMEIERHRKGEDGRWTSKIFTNPTDEIELTSVRCKFNLSEAYKSLTF